MDFKIADEMAKRAAKHFQQRARRIGVDAADLHQVAWVAMLEKESRIDGDYRAGSGALEAFLWTIVRNAVSDHLRSRARRGGGQEVGFEVMPDAMDTVTPEAEASARQWAVRFVTVIDPLLHEEIVRAVIVDEEKPRHVAAALGVEAQHVHTRVRRFRENMAKDPRAQALVEQLRAGA